MSVAVEPHQVEWLREDVDATTALGHDAVFLDRDEVRAEIDSPTYLAGAWDRSDAALVDPARLAWGLRAACLRLGVRIYEDTPAEALQRDGAGVLVRCASDGAVRARHVALGTNAFPALCAGFVRSPSRSTTTC